MENKNTPIQEDRINLLIDDEEKFVIFFFDKNQKIFIKNIKYTHFDGSTFETTSNIKEANILTKYNIDYIQFMRGKDTFGKITERKEIYAIKI